MQVSSYSNSTDRFGKRLPQKTQITSANGTLLPKYSTAIPKINRTASDLARSGGRGGAGGKHQKDVLNGDKKPFKFRETTVGKFLKQWLC